MIYKILLSVVIVMLDILLITMICAGIQVLPFCMLMIVVNAGEGMLLRMNID